MEEDGVKMKVCWGREKGGGVGCGVVVYIRSSVVPLLFPFITARIAALPTKPRDRRRPRREVADLPHSGCTDTSQVGQRGVYRFASPRKRTADRQLWGREKLQAYVWSLVQKSEGLIVVTTATHIVAAGWNESSRIVF
ncbi:hypothetical protein BO82DRAFT_50847 [Aspergillus uvarum CBS 121591]|uniref:Uncharacterized protein n=1 Tax=Aspergillus uvarum CBS 121591 TaxID=1448315 RepID=A0A319CVZ9_9EURO|nr:hypothetical protein BO82DRAFT_50847 [Aspergillus uvarum CBS 121591]PYH86687.1 hypothetical protein BO82DRAFT_50847 [Aspergillus uvarum CBS 121591]